MNITRGKIEAPQKVVIYGTEGIGKSTLASQFPSPVFIDTEGSTKKMDVARFDPPSSWTMLMSQVDYMAKSPGEYRTLVIDTADWAQRLCIKHVCDKHNVDGIETFGYGKGYTYISEEFGKLLNRLDDVIQAGINVVLTAHAQIIKFEQPDEMGAYDRYSMKLINSPKTSISAMVKEWADMVLFCNYKTYSVAVDEKGKKHKAQGGKRVMYTVHHPCWDAKNRDGLPEEVPMDYSSIAHIIPGRDKTIIPAPTPEKSKSEPITEELPEEIAFNGQDPIQDTILGKTEFHVPDGIPKALADLMKENKVTEWDIQAVCAKRGYYPEDTPMSNYDVDFINGCLVGAWPQVYQMIIDLRKELNHNNPF